MSAKRAREVTAETAAVYMFIVPRFVIAARIRRDMRDEARSVCKCQKCKLFRAGQASEL